jgi:hypothetical protein
MPIHGIGPASPAQEVVGEVATKVPRPTCRTKRPSGSRVFQFFTEAYPELMR